MNVGNFSTEQKTNNANRNLCNDLLSSEFSNAIQEAFESENRRKHVVNITRAYYVFIDLEMGVSLDRIEKYRLEPFCSFLSAYVTSNENDKLAVQLLELCDNALFKISA